MSNLVAAHANVLLNYSLAVTGQTQPTSPVKLRLMTANGSASSAGTEVSGGSYPTGGSSLTAVLGSFSGGVVTNSSTLSFTSMPAATVVGVEIWDSAGTPIRLWYGALTANKTTNSGDTLSFASSAISISLA